MLQKFDQTRFTLPQDRPDGTQAPELTPHFHLAAPILLKQVLKSQEEKNK